MNVKTIEMEFKILSLWHILQIFQFNLVNTADRNYMRSLKTFILNCNQQVGNTKFVK